MTPTRNLSVLILLASSTVALTACSFVRPFQPDNELTYIDLVNRLIDMESLAVLPEPGEQTAQWSSYDRRSRYDAETDSYIEWDANLRPDRTGDGDGIIRKEEGGDVLAEMKGPGCIWRIWSAHALSGHLKFYLDGKKTPALDMPFSALFDREHEPFTFPSLVHRTDAKGVNCYVPIPYNKSCKIVAEEGWGRFYQFTYSTFPKGTKLPTFSPDLTSEEWQALAKVDRLLTQNLGCDPAGLRIDSEKTEAEIALAPKESKIVATLEGPLAISGLKITLLETPSREVGFRMLRETVLRITWDDDEKPAVWAPLGDFFGTALGVNHYRSLPLGMVRTEDGGSEFYSYWYMPFEKRAIIEIVNEGDTDFACDVSITTAPLQRPIEDLGRFHAKWHRDAFLPTDPGRAAIEPADPQRSSHPPAVDWTLLKAEGRGRYCGTMLHIWNPKGGWWGEGDEKFFVDGEKFPSTFGTGSEDYFGYAWCRPDLFQNAYHNQTFNGGRNRGHVSVNRWQIQDNIPFQTSFEGAIEKYHPNSRPTLYAAMAYWYQEAGRSDAYSPVPVEERTGYYDYVLKPLTRRDTTIDAYHLRLDQGTRPVGPIKAVNIGMPPDRWAYLAWENAKHGESIDLELPPLETGGLYDIYVRVVNGPEFGSMQFSLDGEKIGPVVGQGAAEIERSEEILLGRVHLEKGDHRLTIAAQGSHGSTSQIGLISVRLDPR